MTVRLPFRAPAALLATSSLVAILGSPALASAQAESKAVESKAVAWKPEQNEKLESHHVRSVLEMGGGLALGATGYWLLMDRQVADWDNPRPEQRFDGTAWRLDNNSLAMNFLGHPFSGAEAHSFARANHHGPWVAFGYGFMTSFLWEFVLEFKEKVSINDVIVTPTAGMPIGEFLYKLGLYLDTSQNPGTGMQIARWVLGTGVTLDRALDGRPPPRVPARDSLGLTTEIWHEFRVHSGLDLVSSEGQDDYLRQHMGFYGKLVTLPGYLGPTSFGRGFYRAEISDFSFATELSEHGIGLSVSADTMLAGFHTQTMTVSEWGVSGAAATFGTSMAYVFHLSSANRYRDFAEAKAQPQPDLSYHVPTRNEQLGAVHFPGLALDWYARAPELAVSVAARVHPSFGGLGAPAFYDWAAANLEEKGKHVTHRQGYFYGWGGAGSLQGRLAAGPLRASGSVAYVKYDSQDGLDRHVERLTADPNAVGDVLFYGASLGIEPAFYPLSLNAEVSVRRWRTEVEGFEREGRSLHRGLRADVSF